MTSRLLRLVWSIYLPSSGLSGHLKAEVSLLGRTGGWWCLAGKLQALVRLLGGGWGLAGWHISLSKVLRAPV